MVKAKNQIVMYLIAHLVVWSAATTIATVATTLLVQLSKSESAMQVFMSTVFFGGLIALCFLIPSYLKDVRKVGNDGY